MTNPVKSDQAEILTIAHAIYAAIQRKDAGRFGEFLADDFVSRSPDGAEMGREEFLKVVASLPVEIDAVRGEHERVDVYGDTAVMTGVQHSEWRQGDQRGASASAFTDVYVRRAGRWTLVMAYTVDLP